MSESSKREMELANFVCKFGSKNLVDYLEDFFLPGVFSGNVRTWGKTSYHLRNLAFEKIDVQGESHYVIYGRFVKNLVLKREQVLEKGRLRKDRAELASAPSAIFLLVLESHRLLYIPETTHAPRIDELANTIQWVVSRFVSGLEEEYKAEVKQKKSQGEDVEELSKLELKVRFPRPAIRATALASKESLRSFISRYSVLKKMQVKVLETNHEIDWDQLFLDVRESGKRLDSSTTEVKYENKTGGLNTETAADHITDIAEQGNHEITLKGLDRAGEELNGNNLEMQLRVPIHISRTNDLEEDASNMIEKYADLIKKKTIQLGEGANGITAKLQGIYSRWKRALDSE